MAGFLSLFFIFHFVNCIFGEDFLNKINDDVVTTNAYVFWPNATVPFYIDHDHFDHEQSIAILTALSLFAFKTCLKFVPVMAPPGPGQHVMVFENPGGVKKCAFSIEPHAIGEPHRVVLGYECLKSPHIDAAVMRALGFPFEHNRVSRDVYLEVEPENIEPGYIELFTKDLQQALELRRLPFDPNSVTHFGERDFSKNGHRTILFKNKNVKQERVGLTKLDLQKIEIVYGPECLIRDRKEKIDLCQNYPGVARRKRDATGIPYKSLRVNPNITPPNNITKDNKDAVPRAVEEVKSTGYVDSVVKELGVEKLVEDLVEQVHKIAAAALQNARDKHCNGSKPALRTAPEMGKPASQNILGIIHETATYAKTLVDKALANLTEFCEPSKSIDDYQRASCPFFDVSKCRPSYKSTKSGPVHYSTKHRPIIKQSTKHKGFVSKNIYAPMYRSGNNTDDEGVTATVKVKAVRRKRDTGSKKAGTKFPDLASIVSKSDLRAGTKVVIDKKGVFAPNYRSSNDTKHKEVAATTEKLGRRREDEKDAKVEDKGEVTADSKIEEVTVKDQRTGNTELRSATRIIKRNFDQRRFRAKKRPNEVPDRVQQGQNWDASRVSLERAHQVRIVKLRMHKRKPGQATHRDSEDEDGAREADEDSPGRLKQKRRPHTPPPTVVLSKRNAEFYNERKWPDNIVRYVIPPGDFDVKDVRKRLAEVNDILRRKTCVSIEELKEEDTEKYEDYLVLDNSPDYVTGRVGGRQPFGVVELLKGGQHRQHAAMMTMAMLGFYFEVSRHDRDKYIRVHMRHVRPDKLHHFEKIREDATFPLPYDYKSATHPAWQFWRQIGRTGISTVATFKEGDPDGSIMKSLGQNEQLFSDLDLVKINSVYGTKCFERENEERVNSDKEREDSDKDKGDSEKEKDGDREVEDRDITQENENDE